MDTSSNQHTHVFDPALGHAVEDPQPQVDATATTTTTNGVTPPLIVNPDPFPAKRRPGRPKGSTKKNLLAGSPLPPKLKRPVGRPRKDGFPAGSVGPRVRRERTAGVQQPMSVVQFGTPLGVSYPFGYSISAPVPSASALPAPAPAAGPAFQLDPSLDNEWAELARTNPNAFLTILLTALAAPNPVSSAGPTVEEAFKSHLVSLAPNPAQMQPIPSLYSILKTFWLPSSPAYFSLTASASTARTPSDHRFLYWDPQPLVFNGIQCPSCSSHLINKGRISSGPVKIYDIERPFFIVGCEYVCRSPACIAATSSPDGRKYASTDSSILRSLPTLLRDEFPARLLYGDADAGSGVNVWNWKAMGVSTGLWNLVLGALRAGLKKDVILKLIWSVQNKAPDVLEENGTAAGDAQAQDQDDEDEDGDEKMDDVFAEEEEGGVDDEPVLPPNPLSEYGTAWKEITASPTKTPAPSGTPNPAASPSTSAAAAAVAAALTPTPTPAPPAVAPSSSQPQPQPQPQLMQAPHQSYNPYTAYPFTPYAYMPHHIVNGQIVPLNPGQQPPNVVSGMAPPNGVGGVGGMDANAHAQAQGASITHSKRSPRHCCKCGSQECKGKGGRAFCTNGCQDCGKLECKGRNSRRPDKKCSEGWT